MSLPRLLLVLLAFFSLGIALAEDQPSQSKKNSVKVTNPNQMTGYQKDAMYAAVQGLLHKPLNGILNPDATCYTMRTYVAHTNFDKKIVVNVGPEAVSDTQSAPNGAKSEPALTQPYTTCTPSLRFDVRTTVETGDNSK